MTSGALADTFGRVATDLRVSLTDRCNLRCSYCMPAEGLDWLPNDDVLTDDEVVRLITIGVERLGVREVRFTGGEPLLRRGLPDIVRRTTALHPRPETSITTNALGLTHMARALAEAGLDRVNVSLDTVRAADFHTITRRDRLHDVVAGLEAAADAGLGPVKVNAVLLRGINDAHAPELLRWCMDRGYELRFIEQMPLDAQHRWNRETMVTAEEIFASLETVFTLTPAEEPRGSAPAELFTVDGGPHTVGVIASVTRPFCGDCDRVRLTADGQVRNCLFAREESDLRGALRGGADDQEIAERWQAAMLTKRPGHGIDDVSFLQPARPMSAIGG
jgi:cyclic pyranopterin phosphate synthase